ncbi:MAG: hypothetical protein K2X81_06320 [Candidatus Obscuribacterales bacterium]|nr:hypothetical protein [Candidatus Obscuribacterales bacterium]
MFKKNLYLVSDCSVLPESCNLDDSDDSIDISFALLDVIDKAMDERKFNGSYEHFLDTIAEKVNQSGLMHYSKSGTILNFAPERILESSQGFYVVDGDILDEYRDDPDLRVTGDELMQIMEGNETDIGFANAALYAVISVLYCDETALCWSRCAA